MCFRIKRYYASGGEAEGEKDEILCDLVTSSNLDDTMCLDILPAK